MKVLIALSCFSAIFLQGSAQKLGRGSCPQTQVLQNFDVTRFLGRWFEIGKYPNLFQRGNCAMARYGPLTDDGRVQVINKEVSGGQVRAVQGFAQLQSINRGDLIVTLRTPVVGNTQSGYDVLGTDYNNWVLVHTCREVLGFKAEFLWILSRQKELSPIYQQQIETLMSYNGLDSSSVQLTNQVDCPADVDSLPFQFIA